MSEKIDPKLLYKLNRKLSKEPDLVEKIKQESASIDILESVGGVNLESRLKVFLGLAPEMGPYLEIFLNLGEKTQGGILEDISIKKLEGMSRADLIHRLCLLIDRSVDFEIFDESDSDRKYKPKEPVEELKLEHEMNWDDAPLNKFIHNMEAKIKLAQNKAKK